MSNQTILERVSQLVAAVEEKQAAKAAAQLSADSVTNQLTAAQATHDALLKDVTSDPAETANAVVRTGALVSVLEKHAEASKTKIAVAEKEVFATARTAARACHHISRQISDFVRSAEKAFLQNFVTQFLLPFGSQAIEEVLKASKAVYFLSEYQRKFQGCWSADKKEAASAIANLAANWQAFVAEHGSKTEVVLVQPK
jgi:predicted ATP-binding protein involved in virulence